MTSQMVEKVARAIADELGDNFDHAFISKPEWNAARGEKGGRFRDINEPFQIDYLDAARAAIEAMREPTEEMAYAGKDAQVRALGGHDVNDPGRSRLERQVIGYRAMIDAALQDAEERVG